MLYVLAIILLIVAYGAFRYYCPTTDELVENSYQYFMEEKKMYKPGKMEFMPKSYEKRLRWYVRGVNKRNSKRIVSLLIKKLEHQKIIQQVENLPIDYYKTTL
jgi:hypothetical protein